MANVSSSNGLEKRPKLRFPGFDEPWTVFRAEELFKNITDKNHPDETVLTIIQGKGTLPREQAGRNILYDDASLSNYKKVEQGDYIIHLRSFEGGLEMANEDGIVSPAYTILRCKKPHSSLFYETYFHTDEFINHVLSKSVEGIRDGRQISYEAFKWLGLPYCNVSEQEKISQLFYTLNRRIEKQQQMVDALKKYKRGLLREVFDKSHLTSECKYECWKEVKLGEICTYRRGSFPQPYGLPEWYDEEHGMPFIQVADVNDNMTINLDTNRHISDMAKNRSVFIPEGTLIVTLQGTIGRVAITTYDAYIDRTLLVIQNISDCVLKEFLMYAIYMKFDVEKQTADGSIIKTITKETLTDFSIYLPSIHEQQRIVNLLRSFDRRLENSVTVLAELHRFRSSLLQQLFI